LAVKRASLHFCCCIFTGTAFDIVELLLRLPSTRSGIGRDSWPCQDVSRPQIKLESLPWISSECGQFQCLDSPGLLGQTHFGRFAFRRAFVSSLASSDIGRIVLDSGNRFLKVSGGFLFDLCETLLIRYFGNEGEVEISRDVK
jgi:hypothetical protein